MPSVIKVKAFALLRRGEEFLVCMGFDAKKNQRFARLPGGHIEFGERAADAVKRELKEEFGVSITEPILLGWIENIFEYNGQRGHEVVAVYEVKPDDPAFSDTEHPPLLDPQEAWIEARWLSTAQARAQGIPLYPSAASLLIQDLTPTKL